MSRQNEPIYWGVRLVIFFDALHILRPCNDGLGRNRGEHYVLKASVSSRLKFLLSSGRTKVKISSAPSFIYYAANVCVSNGNFRKVSSLSWTFLLALSISMPTKLPSAS